MTIPLPDLDTRRWSDLTEQGRASIVRNAPDWTDHNLHDPGITLMELFAWVVEGSIYRVNRIPERHLRKFLALAGFAPLAPRAGRVVLDVTPPAGTAWLDLPAGTVFRRQTVRPEGGAMLVPWQTVEPVTIVETGLAALHVFDGRRLHDRTRQLLEGLAIPLFGSDPAAPEPYDPATSPALYLGFDRAPPLGRTLSLYFHLRDGRTSDTDSMRDELRARAAECAPPVRPCPPCPPSSSWCADRDAAGEAPANVPRPRHHSVQLVWEIRSAAGWIELPEDERGIRDETHALTLSGAARVHVAAPFAPLRLPTDSTERYYLRVRLRRGRFDAAPQLAALSMNAVAAVQRAPAWADHELAPGYTGGGTLTVGTTVRLRLAFDAEGRITHIEPGDVEDPAAVLLGHAPAVGSTPERLRLGLVRLGRGSGLPGQVMELLPGSLLSRTLGAVGCPADCPVAHVVTDTARFWAVRAGPPAGAAAWEVRRDHDASGALDRHLVLDPDCTAAFLGDDVRGRTLDADETMLAACHITLGAGGAVPAGSVWALGGDPVNEALLGPDRPAVADASIRNRAASWGAADAEDPGAAAARAAALLWAHERLVELAAEADAETLDGLDPGAVLSLPAPPRASGILDFERIALSVPGTRVRRARAWAGHHPLLGCALLPGTVTLVIVPALPRGRPQPTPGLLRAVRLYLESRRLLGTRLVVTGPEYVEVGVHATVRGRDGSDAARIAQRVRDRLHEFFDPLHGGRSGRGWPFGRDVYAGEVLQVVDAVDPVDHVVTLRLFAGGRAVECDNVCIPPTGLVASGEHHIEVVA